ncbi:MAG TPA: hypothetical protein PLR90_07280 [Methylophilus sp.]|nr:hypothetical protein [Methylophilus sp.]HQQ33703.1 hypothetical protein [Methylophilus sp.]
MNKFLLALVTVMMLFLVGCASSGGAAPASSGSDLPEIAAYDDEPFDPLPDNVPAE